MNVSAIARGTGDTPTKKDRGPIRTASYDPPMNTLADYTQPFVEAIAAKLADGYPDIAVDSWGIRVRCTEHCDVYLMLMLGGNWRLLEVIPNPGEPDNPMAASNPRGWCYTGPAAFTCGFLAAQSWDGAPDSEPTGWVKSVHDQRRHGEPKPGIRQCEWRGLHS